MSLLNPSCYNDDDQVDNLLKHMMMMSNTCAYVVEIMMAVLKMQH